MWNRREIATCTNCSTEFLPRTNRNSKFCTVQCSVRYYKELSRKKNLINCLNCGKETTNDKYCSKSCAAIINGKLYPKRHWKCAKCSSVLRPSPSAKLCAACLTQSKVRLRTAMSRTVRELKIMWVGRVRPWTDAVRNDARAHCVKSSSCSVCKYSKHVEVCHRQPIASFNDDTTVAEINNPANLIYLCPNCHWEFDNGLLVIQPQLP